MARIAMSDGPVILKGNDGTIYGPFTTRREGQDYAERTGNHGVFQLPHVPEKPLYKGAKYTVVTGNGSIYDLTVTKRLGQGEKGRDKAGLVFPLRTVLQRALDRGPDDYIEV